MSGFYQPFTSNRLTEPDLISLINQLKALDSSAGVKHSSGSSEYSIKKSTIWTQPQINAVQNIINTSPAVSIQLDAQNAIDRLSIFEEAIILTILDQFNFLRNLHGLAPITIPNMIAAIRTKAGTLV